MKILFFINSLTSGGAERVTSLLAGYFVDQGHDVCVVTMSSAELDFYPLDPRVNRISLDLAGVNRGVGKLTAGYRRWRALRRVVKAENPNCIVGMMTTAVVFVILAAMGLPARVYGSERNYPGRKSVSLPWRLLRRCIYRFADGHIAQTQESADWLARYAGARNIKVIPNPVVWPIPSFAPRMLPEQVVPSERNMILAVGTKIDQKGFDLLVKAFSRLTQAWPKWDLVILGIDAESDKADSDGALIQRMALAHGLQDRVLLPGRVGNVADWYQRADLFVLSSRYEGFPNVLLEAMASGCPSIAFDCDTGPRDIIEHQVNGLLVPAENTDELQRSMALMISNEELRKELGAAAVEARSRFSEYNVMTHWAEVIR